MSEKQTVSQRYAKEIKKIRDMTEHISNKFYSDKDW